MSYKQAKLAELNKAVEEFKEALRSFNHDVELETVDFEEFAEHLDDLVYEVEEELVAEV